MSFEFDWTSFLVGFPLAILIVGAWKRRVDRLRWRTLAINDEFSLKQYAKDLDDAENGKDFTKES